ncbi:hypothetical protein VTK73DRAFT_9329 [Phialemonium thermophilum]|uniref:Membrane anchor Opy2 N-terminal domain-containing protein n=1 Tax=Phialemonium thermophilum TaxID=223376 RepID=A0ABR3W2W7_9PEZI
MSANLQRAAVSSRDLLPRGEVCVVCDNSQKLVCPVCGPNEQCQFVFPTNCSECQRAICAPSEPTSTPSPGASSKPSVGAIAGGVIGGVAAIAIVTYLVWRFCIKTKRQPFPEPDLGDDDHDQTVDAEKAFAQRRDQRSSTHTVHSIASTVLTRASNIIQIAYIPGVTNRATPTSPTVLVPPVPPIPIALSQATSPAGTEDQHFFVPGDLRDSTYSGLSGYSDRTSYARTSYAPRSSVASTIYGKNAVIVAAHQTGMRAKPEMVSVRTANTKSSGSNTPPVPSVDYDKYNSGLRPPSPAGSTFSVGSTFLNNASVHTAMPARAQVIRVGSGTSKASKASSAAATAAEDGSSSPSASPLRESSTVRDSAAETVVAESPSTPDQGPFTDASEERPSPRQWTSTGLSSVAEESSSRRASRMETNSPQKNRERSPFGDEHATQD